MFLKAMKKSRKVSFDGVREAIFAFNQLLFYCETAYLG